MSSWLHWRLLQLADSAFPTGGFAHSAGLEAALHCGEVDSEATLENYVDSFLWNVGTASLPFVAAAYDAPGTLWQLDEHIDAVLTNHVANRASRTQGRAFAATCAEVFGASRLGSLAARVRSREVAAHLAPIFGASLSILGLDRSETLGLHLYLALRGVASAAVRLGIVGPHEAQRLLAERGPRLDAILKRCESLGPDDAATAAPVVDIVGATHDRLYARLFQS